MSLILAFDATGPRCAVAVFDGARLLAERVEAMEKGHAERLFPLIDAALSETGRAPRDVDLIAVCTGPGNFTGARIGVAAARGLALSTGAHAVGVDRFEALAAGHDGTVCVALEGRGGGVHVARFESGAYVGFAATMRPEEAAEAATDALVVGDAARKVIEVTGEGRLGPEEAAPPLAAIAAIASNGAPDAPRPVPRYLRPAGAALPAEGPPQIIP